MHASNETVYNIMKNATDDTNKNASIFYINVNK